MHRAPKPTRAIFRALLRWQEYFAVLALTSTLLSPVLVLPLPAYAAAGVPRIINNQGRLMDANGSLLGGAGTDYCFKFSLFDNAGVGSGSQVWPATAPSVMTVPVKQGIYSVGVGDTDQGGDVLDYNFQDNDAVYLNVEVAAKVGATCAAGDGAESFENLSPRQRIFASGYAVNAATVGGFTPAQQATGNQIPVLSAGNLILAASNPFINATSTNALTLQGGGSVSGDIRFFNAGNKLTSAGNLTLTGSVTASGLSSFTNLLIGGLSTTTIQGSTSGTSTIQGFLNVLGTNSTSTFSGPIATPFLNLTGAGATSTAASGFDIAAGCFSIGGVCVGGVNSITANADNTLVVDPTGGNAIVGLNLSNANVWTGLQQFANASSSIFSAGKAFFGATATTTIDSAGNVDVAGTLDVSGNTTLAKATSTSFAITSVTNTLLKTDANGSVVPAVPGSDYLVSAVTSLGAAGQGQTGATQTFATSTTVTNGLTAAITVTSSGNVHTFTPSVTGTLTALGGGTGIANPSAGGILIGSYAGGAYQQIATSSLGIRTTDVQEGSNLYYQDARVNAFIDASTTIPKTFSANIFSGLTTLNGGLTVGSLNGPLQANNGVVSATSSIGVAYGGTGISTAPAFGQLLVGNAVSGYSLVATSTLAIALNDTSGTLAVNRGGTGITSPTAGAIVLGDYSGTGYMQVATSSLGLLTTNVAEGSNLYYQNARVLTYLDSFDKGYFYSTTSADYWKSQNDFYSTTSADYWKSQNNFFSTSSNDFWKSQTNFYSTTSADYWKSQNSFFSTTSSSYFLSQNLGSAFSTTSATYFADASSTIAKTYSNNTFTGSNSFAAVSVTGSTTLANVTAQNATTTNATSTTLYTGTITAGNATVADLSATGNSSFANATATSLFSRALAAVSTAFGGTATSSFGSNGELTLAGGLNGPLQAVNGLVSATSTLSVSYGGTGLTTAPSFGQILLGNSTGGYGLVATSTLGISLSDTTGTLPVARGGTGLTTVTANQLLVGGPGNTVVQIATSSLGLLTTDVQEGTNLYYQNARVLSYLNSFDKGYFYSTTSADYWKSQNTFFSTSSVDFWKTQNNFFSTTSATYFAAQGLAFSTTSSQYFLSQNQGAAFSTTSAMYFADASSTITKSYSNNTFTGSNTFNGDTTLTNATTASLAVTGVTSSLLKTNANGSVVPAVAGVDYAAANASTFGQSFEIGADGYLAPTTSLIVRLPSGFVSQASSTVGGNLTVMGNLTAANATVTNATSTSFFASILAATTGTLANIFGTNATITNATATNSFAATASSTQGFFTRLITGNATSTGQFAAANLSVSGSTTLQNVSAVNATTTNATTTGSAYIASLSLGTALTASNGGTGISAPTAAGILLGNYAGTGYQQLATSSLGLSTTDITEGTNLYYQNARVLSYLDTFNKGYFYSTTSTDYWKTQNNFFSTTSADAWKLVSNFFSTTSSQYFLSQNQGAAFSTTSAMYFADASSTIAKTYSNNTFTGANVFNGNTTLGKATTTSFAITSVPAAILKTDANGSVIPAIAGVDYLTGSLYGKSFEIDASGYLAPTTSVTVRLPSGFVSQASSTVDGNLTVTGNVTAANATVTNATTTSLFASIASSTSAFATRLFVGNATATGVFASNGLIVSGSTTLQNFSGNNATATSLYAVSASTTNLYASNGTIVRSTTTNATSTTSFANTASSTNLFASNFSLGNLTGILKATAGAVSTALVNLATDVTGILQVANGGTGWAAVQAGSLLYGNGSGNLATTTQGSAGQMLAFLNGVPTWVATTTFSNGLTYANGNVTLSSQVALTNASSTALSANDYLSVGRTATTTIRGETNATSTFAGGIQAAALELTGGATSSAAGGFNLTAGCFSVNGTCLGNAQPGTNVVLTAVRRYTATQQWTVPSNLVYAVVEVWGGGGGGGDGDGAGDGTGGGGAGGYASKSYIATALVGTSSIQALVGAGGATTTSASGSTGGTSNFGGFATSTGGAGGVRANAGEGAGGAGGVGSGGDINLSGEPGGLGDTTMANQQGNGGSAPRGGNGGLGGNQTTGNGAVGGACGGGGGGAGGAAGGGGSGCVVIYEYTATNVALGNGSVNSGSTGQVAYYDSAGQAISGSSILYIDSVNGRVGVGSTTPAAALGVSGDAFINGRVTAAHLTATGTLAVTGSTTLQNFTAGNSTTSNATSTNTFATTASSTNLFTSNFTLGGLTGILKATAGLVATSLVDLTSDITGILQVANGGTGWDTLVAGTLLTGNGSGKVATTTIGSSLQISGSSLGLNLSNPNIWTGLQTFTNASTTFVSVLTKASFGSTATTTIDSAGNVAVAGNLNVAGITLLGQATTTNLLVTASTTLQNFTGLNSTTTNATSTTLFVGTASTTNFFASNGTIARSTTTNATTTTLFANTASTTNLFASYATTSNLYVTGPATSTLTAGLSTAYLNVTGTAATSTFARGIDLAAGCFSVAGVCVGTSGGSSFGFPFTTAAFGATQANSTSTLLGFTAGFYSLASSTIGSGAQAGGLTIAGGATTTGNLFVSGNATSSAFFASTASSTNLFTSNFSFGSVTGFLKATAGVVSNSLVNLTSDITGILQVANGGTGWDNLVAGTLLTGNGSGKVATTTIGSSLQISGSSLGLNLSNPNIWTGLQTFTNASTTFVSVLTKASFGSTATTTIDSAGNVAVAGTLSVTGNTTLAAATTSNLLVTGSTTLQNFTAGNATTTTLYISSALRGAGLSACASATDKLLWDTATAQFSCGTDAGAGTGIANLGAAGQLQNGASQTFATSSDTNIGLTITSLANVHTFTTIWNGILSVARGGTGWANIQAGTLLTGNGSGAVATTTIGGSLQISGSSLGLNLANANVWTGLQTFKNASTTLVESVTEFVQTIQSTSTNALVIKSNFSSTAGLTLGGTTTPQILAIDTLNTRVKIGTGGASPVLFVLDTKNTAGDPAGVDGAQYYNSNTSDYRCFSGTTWRSCGGLAASSTGDVQFKNVDGSFTATSNFNWSMANNGLTITASSSSQTADLFTIASSTGAPMFAVSSKGVLELATTTDPTTPAAGQLNIYAKDIAGRIVPKWIGPSGVDTSFQASLGFNKIAMVSSAGATLTAVATALTNVGTLSAATLATTNLKTSVRRTTLTSAAAAGSLASSRATALMVTRGNAAGIGGFFYTARFGLTTLQAGNRGFFGLTDVTTAPANTDPTTNTTPGKVGVAFNANSGNWKFVWNVTGTAPTVADLGTSFPINNTDLLELVMFSKPNDTAIAWRLTNLTSGAQISSTTPATNIPSNTTFLTPVEWMTNNATAVAVAFDLVGWYLESDN